jgi:predicted RNA-binding protein YlxR (DUF448 family)
VGCRERAVGTDLLRVVAGELDGQPVVVLDLRGRLPGRGAHVHPRPECVSQAERRRAFPRALRVVGPLGTTALHDFLEQLAVVHPLDPQGTPTAVAVPPYHQVRSKE